MTHSQKQQVDKIRERESKVPDGPWFVHQGGYNHTGPFRVFDHQTDGVEISLGYYQNLDFIAHARSDIPLLLTLLDEAQRDTERVDAYAKMVRDNHPNTPAYDGRWYFPCEVSNDGGHGGGVGNRYFYDFRQALDQAALARGEGEK